MSRDALVALITKEVLNVVKAKGPQSAASAAPQAPSTGTASPLGDTPLLVVCGNHLGKQDSVRLFGDLKKRFPGLSVLLSNAAVRLFEDSRRPFAGFTLNPQDRDFDQQVAGHSSVLIINTSVNYLAKIAQLVADTQATIVVFNALKAKKPVLVTTDGLLPWYFNSAITAKIQGYLKEIAAYGIEVIAADALGNNHTQGTSPDHHNMPSADTDCRVCPWAGHCARLCPDRVTNLKSEGAVRVASTLSMSPPSKDIAGMIDHTLLKPDATEADVRKLCDEARRNVFASVCVNPTWVSLCSTLLKGTRVKVCTVVGFPLGATSSEAKATETHQAVRDGAEEIDMVINVGALKAGDHSKVFEDIKGVVRAAQGKTVKVILETGLLTDDEKKKGCELSVEAGADFVKTSTGFGPGGATVADIELMRRVVGPKIGVKASGGVRDFETAQKMIKAGATRIGASASVSIVKGSRGEKVTGSGGGDYGYGAAKTAPASSTSAPKVCTPDNKSACE